MQDTKTPTDCQSPLFSAMSACEDAANDFGADLTMRGFGELLTRTLVPRGLSEGYKLTYDEYLAVRHAAGRHLELMADREAQDYLLGNLNHFSRNKRFRSQRGRR